MWDLNSGFFWHCASTVSASITLPWVSKEMSVTQPKDRVERWEREPSRVTWFHAVSLIFCLASETYFTRRWERTWKKIDLGWANIWQRSVGNNHLSWEISVPGDIDGTKNICFSPQSQGFHFSSMESLNSLAANLFIYFLVLECCLTRCAVKSSGLFKMQPHMFWCLGCVESIEELQRDN